VSGRELVGGALPDMLPLLDAGLLPSSACRSKKSAHNSASDSLFSLLLAVSGKNSEDKDGVLGVRWNGERGSRKLLLDAPGRARPACSFCSSDQLRSAAIIWRI
jgi:hypothetical protein